MVYWITAAIVIVTVVKACAEYIADVTVAYLGHRFVADLRIQMFARLARADLNWIQLVHSGRLLSSFLTEFHPHPADGEPLHCHARRELPQGDHSDRHHVLHGPALRDLDPDLHADRLVLARAPATQDAQIDLQVIAGNRRPIGAHHPDVTRHARRARLPAGGQGGGPRRLDRQPRARIRHARHPCARVVESLRRASDGARLRACRSISPAPKACGAI